MGAEMTVKEFGGDFVVLLVGIVGIDGNGTVFQFVDKLIEALAALLTILAALVDKALCDQTTHAGARQNIGDIAPLTPIDTLTAYIIQPPLHEAVVLPPS